MTARKIQAKWPYSPIIRDMFGYLFRDAEEQSLIDAAMLESG